METLCRHTSMQTQTCRNSDRVTCRPADTHTHRNPPLMCPCHKPLHVRTGCDQVASTCCMPRSPNCLSGLCHLKAHPQRCHPNQSLHKLPSALTMPRNGRRNAGTGFRMGRRREPQGLQGLYSELPPLALSRTGRSKGAARSADKHRGGMLLCARVCVPLSTYQSLPRAAKTHCACMRDRLQNMLCARYCRITVFLDLNLLSMIIN